MALSLSAAMELLDGFIHVSWLMQPITRRSKSTRNYSFWGQSFLNMYRIFLAGIRDLGHCPCPRCLIPSSAVPNMGKVRDMKQRKMLARVDDEEEG
jgi:hypothetical protein